MTPNPPTGKEKCGRMLCSSVGFGYGAAYCAEELPCRFHTKGADGLTDIDRMLNAKNKELKKDNPVQEKKHCGNNKCGNDVNCECVCDDCASPVQSPHTGALNVAQAHVDRLAEDIKKNARNMSHLPPFKSDPTLDWERDIDDELRFLTQDGYGGEWSESKKKYIKEIARNAILAERSRIEREVEAKKSRSCDCEECFMHNSALDMVLSLLRDKKKSLDY